MRPFRILLVTIILWFGFTASGQENPKPVILKYDLTSLLGDQVTNSMGVQLGLEYPCSPKISIELDAMYIFPCANCGKPYTTVTTEATNGFSLSAAARHYPAGATYSLAGFYFGPLFSFLHTRSEMLEAGDVVGENHYRVYRNLLSAHVVAGYQLRITGPLFFDPSIGLGTRFVSSWNENKIGTDSGQHEFPYDKDFESGSKWFPSLTINIKIGLKL